MYYVTRITLIAYCVPGTRVRRTLDYYDNSPMHVEVEYWTFEEAKLLSEKIEQRFEYVVSQADVTSQSPFTHIEQKFFHQLIMGHELGTTHPIGDKLFSADLQERYNFLSYRETSFFYWAFKDIVGAIEAKNEALLYEVSRDYLKSQIMGLLHLSGVTNKKPRWMTSYLARMDDEEYESLKLSVEKVINPTYPPHSDMNRYLDSFFSLLDLITVHASKLLDSNNLYPSRIETLEQLLVEKKERESRFNKEEGEWLFDMEFKFREGILNIEHFSHKLHLNEMLHYF